MNRIEELTALLEQITPGPWEVIDGNEIFTAPIKAMNYERREMIADAWGADGREQANARFIAAAPEAMRDLLEVVKAAQVMLDAIDKGSVDSAEIVPVPGDGQPYRFHEEWAHRTRKALEAFK